MILQMEALPYADASSSFHLSHVIVVVVLGAALVSLLRQSIHLANEFDRIYRRSSSLTEPLVPPRLKSDSGLYELLDRHKKRRKLGRCRVLDAFRGLTLILMVFVNYGGGGFALFVHSTWDGLTIADLVFPWFAWILGFSVFLSSSNDESSSKIQALGRIVGRSVKLFTLGLFINNGDSWSEWRIPGVLQALAASYIVVAFADWCHPLYSQSRLLVSTARHLVFGILPLILVNLLLTFTLHVPNCPTGYIGPGGTADEGAYRNCTGGVHLYVDSLVFGLPHLFQTPSCQKRYQTGPYDPEGLLNWLMVATTAYFGYLQAAVFVAALDQPQTSMQDVQNRQLRHLIICGTGLVVLSIVCGGLWVFPNGPWIPLNKNLWSFSYVLLSSGLAAWLLAFLVKIIDGGTRVSWSGAPCISVGKNSIAVYVMHEVCQHVAPFSAKPVKAGEAVSQFELLLYNLVGVLTWVVVAQWMDLRKISIKV